MDNNVILMTWPESGKAFEAQHDLENLSNDQAITLEGVAIVQREADGSLVAKDYNDNVVGTGTLGGSLIGMLVGVLGGPLGLLLGWAGGALIGGSFDLDKSVAISGALSELSKAVPPGVTALVAEVKEGSPAAVDQLANASGATLVRKSTDEVLGELAAAEDAAEAAADEAAKKLHEEKRAERKAGFDKRLDAIKAKLHR